MKLLYTSNAKRERNNEFIWNQLSNTSIIEIITKTKLRFEDIHGDGINEMISSDG